MKKKMSINYGGGEKFKVYKLSPIFSIQRIFTTYTMALQKAHKILINDTPFYIYIKSINNMCVYNIKKSVHIIISF